jgi:hypothetical protein
MAAKQKPTGEFRRPRNSRGAGEGVVLVDTDSLA